MTLGKPLSLPSVFRIALDKEFVCRVPEGMHSANIKTLGKFEISGSASGPCINSKELTTICIGGLKEGCKDPYSWPAGCIIRLALTRSSIDHHMNALCMYTVVVSHQTGVCTLYTNHTELAMTAWRCNKCLGVIWVSSSLNV